MMRSSLGGFFDDVPSAECPNCLATSKARPPAGTRVLLKTKPKPLCVCGHPYSAHLHHDWPIGEQEPFDCLMECGCREYEERNK